MDYSNYGSPLYDSYPAPWANTSDPVIAQPPALCVSPLDQAYNTYLGGDDLSGSELNLNFFDCAPEYPSQVSYYASPAGSAFTESPPSTGRTSQSYFSPPCSPDAENVYDRFSVSPYQVQGHFNENSPAPPYQPLIYQESQAQSSPSQWLQSLPEPTGSLNGLSLSQDDNQLGLQCVPNFQPQQKVAIVSAKPAQNTSLCQRLSKSKKQNVKVPYSPQSTTRNLPAGSAPVVPLPDAMPIPEHSLDLKHSYKKGMFLFKKAHNKRKSVAGFCYLPIENFTTLDDFFDNFVYHPRRNGGVHKEPPHCYCPSGDLRSCDGNKDRGIEARNRKDPGLLFYCLICNADFTAKHNVYFHIAGHFNLKRTGTPCGELVGSDSDGSRHVKGCASCRETGLAHYPIPFDELRYTIVDGAKRTLQGWRFETISQ